MQLRPSPFRHQLYPLQTDYWRQNLHRSRICYHRGRSHTLDTPIRLLPHERRPHIGHTHAQLRLDEQPRILPQGRGLLLRHQRQSRPLPAGRNLHQPQLGRRSSQQLLCPLQIQRQLRHSLRHYQRKMLPDEVLDHDFTRQFVKTWRAEIASGDDCIAPWSDALGARERGWFDRDACGAGQAS